MNNDLALPILGKLERIVINKVDFDNYRDSSEEAVNSNIKISIGYTMGVDEKEYKRYFISVELHVNGTDKSSGKDQFSCVCRLTGYYVSEESFEAYKDELVNIIRVRGMYQIYVLARMEAQSLLRRSGIMVKDFLFEQDDVLKAAYECCSQIKDKSTKERENKGLPKKKKNKRKSAI